MTRAHDGYGTTKADPDTGVRPSGASIDPCRLGTFGVWAVERN